MISIGESEFSLKVTSSLPLPSQSLLVSHFPEENIAKRTEMLSFPFSFFGEIPSGKFVYSKAITTATTSMGSEGRNDCQSKNICSQGVKKVSFCRKLSAVDRLCHERC